MVLKPPKSIRARLLVYGGVLIALPVVILFFCLMKESRDLRAITAEESERLADADLRHIVEGVRALCLTHQGRLAHLPPGVVKEHLKEAQAAIRSQLLGIKVGETGYVFVLDSKGNYVVSGGGKRDGVNVWEAKDSSGTFIIQEMIGKTMRLGAGEIASQQYPWQNPGEEAPRVKTARLVYFAPWDWIIGANSYEEEFKAATRRMESESRKAMVWTILTAIIALVGSLAVLYMLARSLVRPVQACVEHARIMEHGDFSKEVQEEFRQREDETGALARANQSMSQNLRGLLKEIDGGIRTVAEASTVLSSVSNRVAESVKGSSERTVNMATAAEMASANTYGVASSMEQATVNLNTIGAAAEEMSATVAEIAGKAEKARGISSHASEQTKSLDEMVQELGTATKEIGQVTETITAISSQTNLLALNATIEAARAGVAGKGFAVVANEIKELARQTASATEDIKAKIAGVQDSAGKATADIANIARVITEVSEIVTEIATAIEQQSAVTRSVAENIAQASVGVRETTKQASQTSEATATVAMEVGSVNSSMAEISQGNEQVQKSAQELSALTEKLRETIAKFKT